MVPPAVKHGEVAKRSNDRIGIGTYSESAQMYILQDKVRYGDSPRNNKR